jgi:WD40 repeat protein
MTNVSITNSMIKSMQATLVAGVIYLFFCHASIAQIKSMGKPKSFVYDISFSKGGAWLAATEGKKLNLFDVNTTQLIKRFSNGHTEDILSVDISADSSRLVSGGKDGRVVIWDTNTGNILQTIDAHNGVVTAVKFHPIAEIVISAGADNKIVVYDFAKQDLMYQWEQHEDDVLSLAINPEGTILASGGADKSIWLWDLKSGTDLQRLLAHKSWIRSLVFSEDGNKLLSVGDDSRITVWHLDEKKTATKSFSIKHGGGWLFGVDIKGQNPKSEVITSVGMNGKVNIRTPVGGYMLKVKRPIHKALLKPRNGNLIKIALATRGKGILIVEAKDMEMVD